MTRLILAVLLASGSTLTLAHAETAENRAGQSGMRAEMRALIAGDGMKAADLAVMMLQRSQSQFDAIDEDGDGVVTKAQFLAAAGKRAEAMFERMGPNEDGIVTREGRPGPGGRAERNGRGMSDERRAERASAQFERLDADGDGMISPQEFEAGMQARTEQRSERREQRAERREENREQRTERRDDRRERGSERRAERDGERNEQRAGMRQMREQLRDGMDLAAFTGLMEDRAGARFDRLDADGNGEVTSAEFTARVADRADRMFSRMDRNDDGVVTREDRPRGEGRRGEGRGGKQDR